jgi:UDP-N-acetylglucosamine:LPS N-acetylglucosamine transferase
MSRKTILLLYLRTGGGHLAPARSVAEYLSREQAAGVTPILIDGLEHAPRWARWMLEEGYKTLQARAQWFYEFLYLLAKIPIIAHLNALLVSLVVTPYLRGHLLQHAPHRIVIFHFFLIKPVLDILRKAGATVQVLTAVTDPFTAHPLWFLQKRQEFIVFSNIMKRHCIAKGFPETRVTVFPFVLSEKFSRPLPAQSLPSLKQSLGLPTDRKFVLLLGGKDGLPRGETILRSLIEADIPAAVGIVCGTNVSLMRHAGALKMAHPSFHLKVWGFVDTVYELINAAEIVISKCGASTFMEILLLEKIPVIIDYLWEQEKGNVDFLRTSRLGFYEPRVASLPGLIRQLLSDETLASSIKNNIRNAGLQNGVAPVSEFIGRQ